MHIATLASAFRNSSVFLMFGISLAAAATSADIKQAGKEPVIELPKFVVTDSRELPQPESWRYATIPGFEILTNASDSSTQGLMRDFELFRQVLSIVWPVPEQGQAPVLLILCGRNNAFDAFVPAHTEGTPDTAKASLFLKGTTRTAIVIDLQSTVIDLQSLDLADAASGEDSSQFSVEHNKQLYREYVRYLLSRSQPRFPAWFEEGLSQIIMAMKFDRKYIEFGKLEDPNTVSAQAGMVASMNAASAQAAAAAGDDSSDTPDMLPGAPTEDKDFNAVLAHRAILSMDKFFAVTYNSPEAVNPLGNNAWAKQAYAFVHMCLYGENGRWQKSFAQFLIRSTREPVTEAMFKDCFHMSYSDMALEIRGYVQFTNYKSQEYHIKGSGLPVPPPLALRDATPSEVGRIKGEALLLGEHRDKARTELVAPYIRGERDPQLLAALGLLEHGDGKDDRARKFLTVAVEGKTTDPEAYRVLAQMRYADALAKPAGPDHRFSAAQVGDITSLLLTASHIPPPSVTTYELLADTWVQSAAVPEKADVIPLIQGAQHFPGRLRLVYATAALCADAKLFDAAHSFVDFGLKYSPDSKTKANFERLNAALPPDTAAKATPAAATQPKP